MDTRDTAEQAELRRTARALVSELGPARVADLDDDARRARLADAVAAAGWTELRDDAGDGTPLASGVEAGIVAEALGRAAADVSFTGPLLAADLARRAGVAVAPGVVVAFAADLLEPGATLAVDATPGEAVAYAVAAAGDRRLVPADVVAPMPGTDLTRAVARVVAGRG